jgi:hypothetical protein
MHGMGSSQLSTCEIAKGTEEKRKGMDNCTLHKAFIHLTFSSKPNTVSSGRLRPRELSPSSLRHSFICVSSFCVQGESGGVSVEASPQLGDFFLPVSCDREEQPEKIPIGPCLVHQIYPQI